MGAPLHDPVPDGKTGPFMRGPRHNRTDAGYEYDERCAACRIELAQLNAERLRDEGPELPDHLMERALGN